jgi:hypothetical protein
MIKKQQGIFSGKQLCRKEMMRLAGGVAAALGIWSCGKDGLTCYATKAKCNANCAGNGCVISRACIS